MAEYCGGNRIVARRGNGAPPNTLYEGEAAFDRSGKRLYMGMGDGNAPVLIGPGATGGAVFEYVPRFQVGGSVFAAAYELVMVDCRASGAEVRLPPAGDWRFRAWWCRPLRTCGFGAGVEPATARLVIWCSPN